MRRLALVGGLVSSLVVWACAQGGTSDIDPITDAPLDASVNPDEDSGKLPNSSTEDGGKDAGTKDSATDAPVTQSDSGACNVTNLVVNEVKSDGASGSDEFVEFYNPGNCVLQLNGLKLNYSSSTGSTPTTLISFTTAHSIKANGFFVAAGGAFTGTKDVTWSSGGLAAGGGRVAIVDAADKVIDSVGYGSLTNSTIYIEGPPPAKLTDAAPAPPTNKSVGRKPDGKDTNLNSADFVVTTSPTPGAANN